jgi:hypothetical protein
VSFGRVGKQTRRRIVKEVRDWLPLAIGLALAVACTFGWPNKQR